MNTVTTSAKDLRHLLTAAIAFIDPEDDLQPLTSVYLEAAGGVITATGSDRYVLGHARATATGQWESGLLVDREHAEWIAKGLAMLGTNEVVELTAVAGEARAPRLRVHHHDMTVEVPTAALIYPDYRSLFRKFDDQEPSLDATLLLRTHALDYLGKLRELFGYDATRWTVLGATEPIRVEVGDNFAALIMPAKQDAPRRGWPVPIGVPEPATADA